LHTADLIDEFIHQHVISGGMFGKWCIRQKTLNIIYHETGHLRRKYTEVIGNAYENDTDTESDAVFPEIFIKGLKMFQPIYLCKDNVGWWILDIGY